MRTILSSIAVALNNLRTVSDERELIPTVGLASEAALHSLPRANNLWQIP